MLYGKRNDVVLLAYNAARTLERTVNEIPRDFRYAVEVRNPGLLGMSYLQVLSRHGVANVYNHWSYMPSLAEQHAKM